MPEETNKEVLEPINEGTTPTLADTIIDLVEKKGYSIKISPCWKDGLSQITLEKGTQLITLRRESIINKLEYIGNADTYIKTVLNHLEQIIESKEEKDNA